MKTVAALVCKHLHFHWQNLNERRVGGADVVGRPWHGRAWLRCGQDSDVILRFEWAFDTRDVSRLSLGFDANPSEREVTLFSRGPLGGFYATVFPRGLFKRFWPSNDYEEREVAVRHHDRAIWWRIGGKTMSWNKRTPRWMDENFQWFDVLFGKSEYKQEEVEERAVDVPLPEGTYRAKVRISRDTWSRKRWRTETMLRAHIKMEKPIPIPGKGENSWDCGDDAIHGMTCVAEDIPQAVSIVVQDALRTRLKRGGMNQWYWPAARTVVAGPR